MDKIKWSGKVNENKADVRENEKAKCQKFSKRDDEEIMEAKLHHDSFFFTY